MKINQKYLAAALIVLAFAASACTRSASGGASDVPSADSELPNPVSTQSQLMKEIIAGTQTAMAVPLDATDAAPADGEGDDAEAEEVEATTEPKEAEETSQAPLPTSTPGPAPEVKLKYNSKLCAASDCDTSSGQTICTCFSKVAKDKNVTLQISNPFFADGTDITFLMGPDGEYDFSKYLTAGVAEFKPTDSGRFFEVKLNIPDSLRGKEKIVVRVETENPIVFNLGNFQNN